MVGTIPSLLQLPPMAHPDFSSSGSSTHEQLNEAVREGTRAAAIGVVASLGIGGSLIYALKPAGEKQAKELYSTDSRATSETITSGPRDYSQAPKLGPPLPGDLGGPIVSAQQRGENVPIPPVGAQPDPRTQAEEAARQRAQQERDAARMSGVFLGGSSAGAAAMPSLPNLAIATPDAAAPPPMPRRATRPPSAPSWRRRRTSARLASSA